MSTVPAPAMSVNSWVAAGVGSPQAFLEELTYQATAREQCWDDWGSAATAAPAQCAGPGGEGLPVKIDTWRKAASSCFDESAFMQAFDASLDYSGIPANMAPHKIDFRSLATFALPM